MTVDCIVVGVSDFVRETHFAICRALWGLILRKYLLAGAPKSARSDQQMQCFIKESGQLSQSDLFILKLIKNNVHQNSQFVFDVDII